MHATFAKLLSRRCFMFVVSYHIADTIQTSGLAPPFQTDDTQALKLKAEAQSSIT